MTESPPSPLSSAVEPSPPAPIPQDRGFLRSLVSSDDRSADSIIFGGLSCLLSLSVISGYVAFRDPASWNAISFGSAAAAIIAAAAAGRTARDWRQPPGPGS